MKIQRLLNSQHFNSKGGMTEIAEPVLEANAVPGESAIYRDAAYFYIDMEPLRKSVFPISTLTRTG